jgi:hypothetical protein
VVWHHLDFTLVFNGTEMTMRKRERSEKIVELEMALEVRKKIFYC